MIKSLKIKHLALRNLESFFYAIPPISPERSTTATLPSRARNGKIGPRPPASISRGLLHRCRFPVAGKFLILSRLRKSSVAKSHT